MTKYRYEIDPHNRLVIAETGKKTKLQKFRRVFDGRFRTGKGNSLTYHIKAPQDKYPGLPYQFKLKGRWALTRNHDLKYTFDKWERATFGDKILIRGEILDVRKNSILFGVVTKKKGNVRSTYILELQGSWQADKHNRLTFKIKKGRDKHDILVFHGSWKVNKNHKIIYSYERRELKKRQKKTRTLTFTGHWDINSKTRISYILDKRSGSGFDFRVNFGIFKNRYIKYEVGVRLSRKKQPKKTEVTLFGKWRIRKNADLIFEIKYGDSGVYYIKFKTEVRFTKNGTLVFGLKNGISGKDLGVELKLAYKIRKGSGETFLKFLRSGRESALLAGTGVRW